MASVYPTSLVMRTLSCFYCDTEYENDEPTLGRTFGIRYCTEHKAAAKRDSNAYLHANYCVKLHDALAHEALGPFLRRLLSPVHIRRSNGLLEGGWTLERGDDKILSYANDEWHVPMELATRFTKSVALSIFEHGDVAAHNDPALQAQIPEIRAILDEGIYKADYDAQDALSSSPVIVRDSANIGYCVLNGELRRVFMGGDT